MDKDNIICLLMATMLEAKPFIAGLSLTKLEQKPFPVYSNKNYFLIISGIGKTNSAMACTYSCFKFKPSCIMNMGAAGATRTGYVLGEPLNITKAFEYDRPQFNSKAPHSHMPDILKGFTYATIATFDRPVLDPVERRKISKTANLIDMESASIIQACNRFKIKCYVFKFVSDTPEHIRDNDIIENIKVYRNAFFSFFRESVMPLL